MLLCVNLLLRSTCSCFSNLLVFPHSLGVLCFFWQKYEKIISLPRSAWNLCFLWFSAGRACQGYRAFVFCCWYSGGGWTSCGRRCDHDGLPRHGCCVIVACVARLLFAICWCRCWYYFHDVCVCVCVLTVAVVIRVRREGLLPSSEWCWLLVMGQ